MISDEKSAEQLLADLRLLIARAETKVDQLQDALMATPTKKAFRTKPFSEWKPRVHFSADDVLEVVRLHRMGFTKAEIAGEKGCSSTYIANIISGRQWSRVTGIKRRGG